MKNRKDKNYGSVKWEKAVPFLLPFLQQAYRKSRMEETGNGRIQSKEKGICGI